MLKLRFYTLIYQVPNEFDVSFIGNAMIVGSSPALGTIFESHFFAILSPFVAIFDLLLIIMVVNVIILGKIST